MLFPVAKVILRRGRCPSLRLPMIHRSSADRISPPAHSDHVGWVYTFAMVPQGQFQC